MRLGADPEVFLCDQKGRHISAIGRFGGTKEEPLQVRGLRKGFTLQEDNVALEFGIPPAANADEFVANIQTVMRAGLKRAKGLQFSGLSATVFPRSEMTHPAAYVFGCEPDYNAWTGAENRKPQPDNEFFRSAGGHIHVETKLDPMKTVRNMDLFIGVPATLMDEAGQERRKLYGGMGACRPKSYGVEYRTPSNFWIFDEKYIRWVWRATEAALKTKFNVDILREPIEEAINGGNINIAKMLVKDFNLEMV